MGKEINRAVYAGTFDPPTNGHLWMIKEGAKLFSNLVVLVGVNPAKSPVFSIQERVEMLSEITDDIINVSVSSFENDYLVNCACDMAARYILRGIRNEKDFAYEIGWKHVNFSLNQDIGTVFLIPPKELTEVSSSLVKGMIGPQGWEVIVKEYVPNCVYNKIIEKFKEN